MNFVSDAIEFMDRIVKSSRRQGRRHDYVSLQTSVDWLRDGVKFLLPMHGRVGVTKLETEMFKLTRCPYPVMVFEYETTKTLDKKVIESANEFYGSDSTLDTLSPSSKRLIIVIDGSALGLFNDVVSQLTEQSNPEGVLIQPVSYFNKDSMWIPSPVGIWVPRDNVVETIDFGNNKGKSFKTLEIPMMLDTLREMRIAGFNHNDLIRDCAEEVSITINTLIALNARNVKQVSVPPCDKLNKKRVKNNREPLYEYKVLDIFLGGDIRGTPSGRGRRDALIQQWLRNPAKLHTVIGHFKHRKTGIFWWSDYMRGNPARGQIEKEYRVKTK
jgi:hypothetical protein